MPLFVYSIFVYPAYLVIGIQGIPTLDYSDQCYYAHISVNTCLTFCTSQYIPSSRNSKSYTDSAFYFFRKCLTTFYSCCTFYILSSKVQLAPFFLQPY